MFSGLERCFCLQISATPSTIKINNQGKNDFFLRQRPFYLFFSGMLSGSSRIANTVAFHTRRMISPTPGFETGTPALLYKK